MQAGLDTATRELKSCRECLEANPEDTENRIILITDAQPNEGDISDDGLLARMKANAADNIFTTIIGKLRAGWGERAAASSTCWCFGEAHTALRWVPAHLLDLAPAPCHYSCRRGSRFQHRAC
jgi:hypothetical protein